MSPCTKMPTNRRFSYCLLRYSRNAACCHTVTLFNALHHVSDTSKSEPLPDNPALLIRCWDYFTSINHHYGKSKTCRKKKKNRPWKYTIYKKETCTLKKFILFNYWHLLCRSKTEMNVIRTCNRPWIKVLKVISAHAGHSRLHAV